MGDTQRIFRRKLYDKMLAWKQQRCGKTALLIRGARRVGKSTIAEYFAKSEYDSYIRIDFSNAGNELIGYFDDISDLNWLFLRLKRRYNTELFDRRSCIIFDEVQLCPKARQAIKHLVADGRYDYIETGSLLSIRKNVQGIVIPSEETRVDLLPMDYEEFRWALGDTSTFPYLREMLERQAQLGGDHRRLMREFRLYMLVGGMPQAVNCYLDSNSLAEVDAVKREIINLYEEDFRKIDPKGNASLMFSSIPAQLNSNANRFQVGKLIPTSRNERAQELIADMVDSMTVTKAHHANDPNVGMSMNKSINCFKLFAADTGLFVTLAFKDRDFTESVIYDKLLSDKLSANLGYVYENVVAQMLRAAGSELYYYSWRRQNSNTNYEVDFIIQRRDKICPIEVKSSGYRTHSSLDEFTRKFSSRILHRYVITVKDLRREGDVTFLPVYMAGLI